MVKNMFVKEIKEFLEKEDEYIILTIEDVKVKLNELGIDAINLDDRMTYINDGNEVSWLYNDYEHPIVLRKDDIFNKNTLYVNPNWYLDNKELCDEFFGYICSNVEKEEFSIDSSSIINDKLIEALCLNKKLRNVSLAIWDEKP